MSAQEKENSKGTSLYERLLNDMVDGKYAHGTPLRVQAIAKKYGTSVNPVREVLRRMEGEGLVDFERNKGATVATLDRQQVINIFELIRLIEPYLTAGFAENCTRADVNELEELNHALIDAPIMDRNLVGQLDMGFHMKIVQSHYNQYAVRTWISKRQLLNTLTRRKVLTKVRRMDVIDEHSQLIAAFRENDVTRARDVITRHIDGAGQALYAHLDLG